MEDTSQLNTNVSSSDNGNSLGLVLQIKESVAVDTQVCTRDLGDSRTTACDEDEQKMLLSLTEC